MFGYVLCTLGVTFATDTGIVSTVAWSVWVCRWYWQREPLFNRRMCRAYAGAVAGVVLAVNFYNVVICHAAPVLCACFFPMLAEVNAQTRLPVHKQQLPMLDPAVWETGDVQKIPVPAEDPIFYDYIRESNADKTE